MTLDELQVGLEDPRMQSYFLACGLDLDDTARLFTLIDDDGSGEVDIGEFLEGCLRLKGQARSIDMHQLIHESRKIEHRVTDLANILAAKAEMRFTDVTTSLTSVARHRDLEELRRLTAVVSAENACD